MSNLKGVFLHESDEWGTPKDFFEEINKEFGFNLDPCATEENHKCDRYFTKEDDGLLKDWGGGTECFAIPHIQKFQSGLRSVTKKVIRRIL